MTPEQSPAETLAAASRAASRLEGRAEALAARNAEIVRDVGLAKGRAARRPEVEAFLERLQASAHDRSVGAYERMLTAIVADVLPDSKKIGLELHTERGLPALDVFADNGGEREDILDGCGGSVANLVSAGLRFIAMARSGTRRFMALDEADCWLKPTRIPAFANVLRQIAEELGVQALMISHHDMALFGEGISVVRFARGAEGGVEVEPDPRAPKWPTGEEGARTQGIRWIRLVDVMSHVDTRVPMAPGVNAIVGENDIGKSVVMTALRALAYGEVSDSVVRHGAKAALIEVGIEAGRVVSLERRAKGAGHRNVWRLREADGGVIVETPGRTVPDWVGKELGIARLDGIEVHLSHQKRPIFVLDQPANVRAAVLSVGRESGLIRLMIAKQKENATRDDRTVREGERELTQVRAQLAALDGLSDLVREIEALRERGAALAAETARLDGMLGLIERIEGLDGAQAALKARLDAFGDRLPPMPEFLPEGADRLELADRIEATDGAIVAARAALAAFAELPEAAPEIVDVAALDADARRLETLSVQIAALEAALAAFEGLPAEPPAFVELDAIVETGRNLALLDADVAKLRRRADALAGLPAGEPAMVTVDGMDSAAKALEEIDEEIARLKGRLAQTDRRIEETDRELAAIMEEIGDVCPLCGHAVEGHDHGGGRPESAAPGGETLDDPFAPTPRPTKEMSHAA